jgi:hypothetical protein
MPMAAQQGGHLLALTCLSACSQIESMKPRPLLEIRFTFHAALQLVSAFSNPWYRFSPPSSPLLR